MPSFSAALYMETCLEATDEPACLLRVLVPVMSNSALTFPPSGSVTVERSVWDFLFTQSFPVESLTDSPAPKDTAEGVLG
ncbi:hypothetical protein D3C74_359030 [compost metagenome]